MAFASNRFSEEPTARICGKQNPHIRRLNFDSPQKNISTKIQPKDSQPNIAQQLQNSVKSIHCEYEQFNNVLFSPKTNELSTSDMSENDMYDNHLREAKFHKQLEIFKWKCRQ